MSYDGQGQLSGMTEIQVTNSYNAGSYNTAYVYDGRERLVSESRSGEAVTFQYAPTSDQLQAATSPAGPCRSPTCS